MKLIPKYQNPAGPLRITQKPELIRAPWVPKKITKDDYMQTDDGKVIKFQLPEITVIGKSPTGNPLKDANLYGAYRGRKYYREGMEEARPLALGLAALTAAPALTGVGFSGLVEPLDAASVYLNPTDWMNWLPFGLHGLSKADRFTPNRIRLGVYNNVMPGSYKESYIEGKRLEILNAAKDIVKGNTTYENPKWRDWMSLPFIYNTFNWGDDAELAEKFREEAWKKSLGIPHKDKYFIDTGKVDEKGHKIYSYNLKEIPDKHIQYFIKNTHEGSKVMPDYLGNTGGWVSAKQEGNTFTMEDLWDIQPLQNPNREGLIPKKIKPLFAKKIPTPENLYYPFKWEYRKWVPEWFKEFDPTSFIGKGPFRNVTKIDAKPLSRDLYTIKESLDKVRERLKKEWTEAEVDYSFIPDENTTKLEFDEVVNRIADKISLKVDNMSDKDLLRFQNYEFTKDEELLKKYGYFYRK